MKAKGNMSKKISGDMGTLLVILAVVAVMILLTEPARFFTGANFKSMAFQIPEFGILSLGMMICMISGGIDLSNVGIANLSAIVAALLVIRLEHFGAWGIAAAVMGALVCGALCGLLNGFLVGYMQIPAMVATLSTMQIFTGLGVAVTRGPAIVGLPDKFLLIGNGTVFGNIPISLLIFAAVCIALMWLMRYTVFGRQLCMVGSNSVAAKYTGIQNLHIYLKTYVCSGVLAGIAGIVICSHYGSAKSDYGSTYTLLTLLIVILGGTKPEGGKGKVTGVVMAVVILQVISSMFSIIRVNSHVKTAVWGLVLAVVMMAKYGGVQWAASFYRRCRTLKRRESL